MKVATGFKIALGIAGIGAAYLLIRQGRAAASVVADAAQSINPFNNDNIFNRAFTDVYQDVTGSTGTLGGDLYDFTHPPAAAGTNPINGAAVTIYQRETGSKGTMGTDLYDLLNPAPGEDGVLSTYWKAWTGQPNRMGWNPFGITRAAPPVDNTILDARDALAKRTGYTQPSPSWSPMGDVYHGGD